MGALAVWQVRLLAWEAVVDKFLESLNLFLNSFDYIGETGFKSKEKEVILCVNLKFYCRNSCLC